MATSDNKGFFDRLGEILNTPLPGTQAPADPAAAQSGQQAAGDDGLLGRIRDILSQPLPGTMPAGAGTRGAAPAPPAPVETQVPAPAPAQAQAQTQSETAPHPHEQMAQPSQDLSAGTLGEDWWHQDWAAYEAHRAEESRGLALKQEQDMARLAAFQEQERQRFAAHQQQEEALFRQHQQWKLNAWNLYQESIRTGRPLPPPFLMPPGGQFGMPPGMPPGMMPPWMRRPR